MWSWFSCPASGFPWGLCLRVVAGTVLIVFLLVVGPCVELDNLVGLSTGIRATTEDVWPHLFSSI